MPSKPTKGTKGLFVELPIELLEEYKNFVFMRREKIGAAVERALRRDMAYPAPVPVPAPVAPLLDVEPVPEAKPKRKKV